MNNLDLKDRVAIITGGAQGFGKLYQKELFNLVEKLSFGI